jgi:23S rRNA (guanine2445-N2)-methyltransferase / 23S rRNA (guanine2069-N7)-methyltransferase
VDVYFLCPPHCGPWLEKELQQLGVSVNHRAGRLIGGQADLETIYRACLYSRVASRILIPIAEGPADSDQALMESLAKVDWPNQILGGDSLAIDFRGTGGWLNHSRFGRQRLKDGIVDGLRAAGRDHPELKPEAPDVLIFAHFDGKRIQLYRDLGAGPLHQRGYRRQGGGAPIKENLAAAILMAAGWPDYDNLVDPFCGSGTLVIEAALMKGGIAPGLFRRRWGFRGWPEHEAAEWQRQKSHARNELDALDLSDCRLAGYDKDPEAITAARANAAAAGLEDWLIFARRDMADLRPPPGAESGLVISNPPYGERLEERADLPALFSELGERLRGPMKNWRFALLATDSSLLPHTGLDRRREFRFRNGPLDCQLVLLWPPPPREGRDLENRLLKNIKHLKRWAGREDTDAFRVYDADIPEFALAVDCYGEHALVQEYAPPKEIPADKAERRLAAGVAAVARALELPGENIHLRTRRPQKGREQYTRLAKRGLEITVHEGPARFIVNLSDYNDSGLFLDHRPVRRWVREKADGKRFLNLFAYTATATVHAALGGARQTTSVDLNRNYLDWGKRNLALNELDGEAHEFIRADCLEWLQQQNAQWDLILLDPPTFSNSSRMDDTLDIQRDHPELIHHALNRLAPGGLLIFSCNRRDFRLQLDDDSLQIQDMTAKSIPEDFKRNRRIHHCWFISRKG